jgi:hypothetical protein
MVLIFVATKFVVRQNAELSLAVASVAFLFGLLFHPEDGVIIFPQLFSFCEVCDITQDSVIFLQNSFSSYRVTSIER